MPNTYLENCQKMSKVFNERPWLFTKNELSPITNYLMYFEYRHDINFFIFPAMFPFKVDILDKYEKKVYNTMFLPTASGTLSMHTIIQVNPSYHILFLYGYSPENELVVYATLYTPNPTDYREFLNDNQKFVHEDQKSLGFGIPPMHDIPQHKA